MSDLFKGDGESWEDYSHRLERRIFDQRQHILSLTALRDDHGDKKARRRIRALHVALGKATERWERERTMRRGLVEALRTAERDALNSKDSEAVLPASDCSPPDLEALEAERREWREKAREGWQAHADLEGEMEAVEAARDQAIKERDRLHELGTATVRALNFLVATNPTAEALLTTAGVPLNALSRALAGVPGGSEQGEQEDLGGTAGAVPGSDNPKGER